jgi:hypothetical protein
MKHEMKWLVAYGIIGIENYEQKGYYKTTWQKLKEFLT